MKYLTIAACVVLAGCSKLDSGVSWAPSLIKQPPPAQSSVPPEPRPDLDVLLREQAHTAFSNLKSLQASEPTPNGSHWQFCAKVATAGVVGGNVAGTYVVEVEGGSIHDRRKDTNGLCDGVSYRLISLKN